MPKISRAGGPSIDGYVPPAGEFGDWSPEENEGEGAATPAMSGPITGAPMAVPESEAERMRVGSGTRASDRAEGRASARTAPFVDRRAEDGGEADSTVSSDRDPDTEVAPEPRSDEPVGDQGGEPAPAGTVVDDQEGTAVSDTDQNSNDPGVVPAETGATGAQAVEGADQAPQTPPAVSLPADVPPADQVERPAQSARKSEWVDYVRALDPFGNQGDPESLTKDQLMELADQLAPQQGTDQG